MLMHYTHLQPHAVGAKLNLLCTQTATNARHRFEGPTEGAKLYLVGGREER